LKITAIDLEGQGERNLQDHNAKGSPVDTPREELPYFGITELAHPVDGFPKRETGTEAITDLQGGISTQSTTGKP